MGALDAARKLFKEELRAFLRDPYAEGDIAVPLHRLKGGAGLLQLDDVRTLLTSIQETVRQQRPIDDYLERLKGLHEQIP